MFTAALFITAKTRKQPKCPPAEEWIKKMWCSLPRRLRGKESTCIHTSSSGKESCEYNRVRSLIWEDPTRLERLNLCPETTEPVLYSPCSATREATERLLLNHTKTPGFLTPGGEEFNPGPETRLDRSELLCNKVLLKYKGDRESF